MSALRAELPPLPARLAKLSVRRGYPVPWFVAWVGGEPEFRLADPEKRVLAWNRRLCWVCGERLGATVAFVVGPMCAVNRISGDPPMHRECAEWSAIACPFLARPHMARREGGLPEAAAAPGTMIARNPGVALLWVTKRYDVTPADGGFLFRMGDPREVSCFAQGRRAEAPEVRESLETGLPTLRALAEQDGPVAVRELERAERRARALLGIG